MPLASSAPANDRLIVGMPPAPIETAAIVQPQRVATPADQIAMAGQCARKMIRQGKQAAQRFVPGRQLPTIVEQAHPSDRLSSVA